MSTITTTHGMNGTLVAPDWPPLTLEEVRTLLVRFRGCGEPIRILSTSPRPFSAASVVGTRGSKVFIKRHHRLVRDREGLLEEHRFIGHLHSNGAPVPRVLESISGETAIEIGEWTYEVHEVPSGVDLYGHQHSWTPFHSPKHAHTAGRTLAQLHLASCGFAASARRPQPLVAGFSVFAQVDAAAAMAHYLALRPVLTRDLITRNACAEAFEILAPFHTELKPLLSALEPLWTQNDAHASNFFWSDGSEDARAVAIFDFGLCDRTNAVHDIALAIERNIVEWLALNDAAPAQAVPIHVDALLALLDGYESLRPLSTQEAAALAPMTALCHVEYALSEAEYYLGVLHSPKRARLAVPDYLVGHARWFASNGGTVLLDAIRQWASVRPARVAGAR
jgi:Ser/Thr protein kinase RdoA (MazF antagonist)